ncbi:protein FAM217B isoform X2 [Lepus europaeus]|uniref:protein FAM217B isoform X2 n=1 Tax=Lepus europaeus TaxID=9983 RepID=UPI002B479916|nr:protein FAM217B isoform X2 [Lepus europaeus]
MKCCGAGNSSADIRGIKKSPRQPSPPPSPSRLSRDTASTGEKTVHATPGDGQPRGVHKKRNRVNEAHREGSVNAGPSWNKVQRSKNSSGRRQSKSRVPCVSSQLNGSLVGVSQPTEDEVRAGIAAGGKPKRDPSSRGQGASASQLFLDFESMKIIKESPDEDSASDLSDSERVPIPPSPLTPPDLHLRAEEIDPLDFAMQLGHGHAKPEHSYPDFLPPPYSSWDLRAMALLLHTECSPGAVPRAGGLLGKYVDRLLQLEWLQLQTIQCEKAKAAKARPPPGPGPAGALKSPGRRKLSAGALSKPPARQEGCSKSGPSRKKGFPHEEAHPSYRAFETSPKPSDVAGGTRLCSQKQKFEMRMEEKKRKSTKSLQLQRWDPSCGGCSPKMETSGNMRVPRQPAPTLDSADPWKAPKTQALANLKKKANANSCGHATMSSEKKLKTNGVKEHTHRLK